ncbi:MAG: chemotaxis protein CheW [candidate division WOR-3 bacterium]
MFELLICKIRNLKIGIEVNKIIEIVESKEITNLPPIFKTLKGMFNLRGDILPFLDIGEILFKEKREGKFNYFVIVESEKGKIGIGIDEVIENIKTDTIPSKSAPGKILSEVEKNFLKGVLEKKEEIIYIIDVNKLIEREDI